MDKSKSHENPWLILWTRQIAMHGSLANTLFWGLHLKRWCPERNCMPLWCRIMGQVMNSHIFKSSDHPKVQDIVYLSSPACARSMPGSYLNRPKIPWHRYRCQWTYHSLQAALSSLRHYRWRDSPRKPKIAGTLQGLLMFLQYLPSLNWPYYLLLGCKKLLQLSVWGLMTF